MKLLKLEETNVPTLQVSHFSSIVAFLSLQLLVNYDIMIWKVLQCVEFLGIHTPSHSTLSTLNR